MWALNGSDTNEYFLTRSAEFSAGRNFFDQRILSFYITIVADFYLPLSLRKYGRCSLLSISKEQGFVDR